MTALQMKLGAPRESETAGLPQTVGEMSDSKEYLNSRNGGMNVLTWLWIIDQSNIHESLYQPAWQSLCS